MNIMELIAILTQLDRVARIGDGGLGKRPVAKILHEMPREMSFVFVRDIEWDLWNDRF